MVNENQHKETVAPNLDNIITTQAELGPIVPDGGYGWVVFIATLFFQALIPSLAVSFGIFLVFAKLEAGTADRKNPALWDEKILNVPLFFWISRSFFSSFTRKLILKSTWYPRLVSTSGTCLTCAGFTFMWMGATGDQDDWLFIPAGILTGLGASLLIIQCEALLAQYFYLKLTILNQLTHIFISLSFVIAPPLLTHYLLRVRMSHVFLCYVAVIIQGLVIGGVAFKRAAHVKTRIHQKPYQSVAASADDEEDIFSKNSRELQIKRQTSRGPSISKIDITEPQAGPSSRWETFEDAEEELPAENNYQKLDWETFDDDELKGAPASDGLEDVRAPAPLFSNFPVNMNNSYSYDDEAARESPASLVFMADNAQESPNIYRSLNLFLQPTFYKSLLMTTANSFSSFVFYTLFPSYLYIEVEAINMRDMAWFVGMMSLVSVIFNCMTCCLKVDRKKRALFFWVFCWAGCVGYFMISDFTNYYVLRFGGVLILISINYLDHFGKELMGLTAKGEANQEYMLLNVLSSIILLLFMVINGRFRDCFRFMAILQFFTGALWLSNFIYNKLRVT